MARRIRALLAGVLGAVLVLFGGTTATAAPTFIDVPANNQFYNEIEWLAAEGISTGWSTPQGKEFRPLDNVARDAMAAFMYRLAGNPPFTPPATSPFRDVPRSNMFYKEIAWLAAEGISTGWETPAGKEFRPLDPVNRDAMAAFFYRFAGKPAFTPPVTSPFVDVATSNVFYKEIAWMKKSGISTGYTDGTYRPLAPVKRDAMAAFMYRLEHLDPTDPTAPAPVTDVQVWPTSQTSLELTWTNPSNADFAGVMIRRAVGSSAPSSISAGTLVANTGPGASWFEDTGLAPGTTYSYALFARNSAGTYATRATATGTTDTPPAPPPTVTSISPSSGPATGGTRVTVTGTNFVGVSAVMFGSSPGTNLVVQSATTLQVTSPESWAGPSDLVVETPNGYSDPVTFTYTAPPPPPVTGVTAQPVGSTSARLAWTNPTEGDFAGVMIRRAQGSTAPTSTTSGTLVATVEAYEPSTYLDTGLTPSTTYSYSLFAFNYDDIYAARASASVTTGTPPTQSVGNWPQPGYDAGQTGHSPTERTINVDNVASLEQEWALPGSGVTAVLGNELYVSRTQEGTNAAVLEAYSLQTAQRLWSVPLASPASAILATDELLVLQDSSLRAYRRTGQHELVWDTADTDPGATISGVRLLGDRLVTWGNGTAVYSLSDGGRVWQVPPPAGRYVLEAAAAGSTVVVAYDNQLRGYSLANGSLSWTRTGVTPGNLIVTSTAVYTHQDGQVRSYSLTAGAPGWTAALDGNVYRLAGADAENLYVWEATFDFGPPAPSELLAVRLSDGAERWRANIPTRLGSFAVTGDLVWFTTSEIYNQGRFSALVGLDRTTGIQVYQRDFDDNMYNHAASFAAGKVIFSQGGSFGGEHPHLTRVFGLGGAVPEITSKVLPLAYTGTAYATDLVAEPTATWSVVAGALPPGISLTPAGRLQGTANTAGTYRATLRATAANGRYTQVSIPLGVVTAATPAWPTQAGGTARNAFLPGDRTMTPDSMATVSQRWVTGGPNLQYLADGQLVADGERMYAVSPADYTLRAWSTAGTAANRAPIWTSDNPDGNGYNGALTVSGGTVFATTGVGTLRALRSSDGQLLWEQQIQVAPYPPLVVGSTVIVSLGNGLAAYNVATGAHQWTTMLSDGVHVGSGLSSDGTRVFFADGCDLTAHSVSTGAQVWRTEINVGHKNCASWMISDLGPLVADGKVYAKSYNEMLIANAATGAVVERRPGLGTQRPGVVAGGVQLHPFGDQLVAMDAETGALLWSSYKSTYFEAIAVVGDLVFVDDGAGLAALSRVTGEPVWRGPTTYPPAPPIVSGGLILVPTDAGVRAYGKP